jgi:hypothetical protein
MKIAIHEAGGGHNLYEVTELAPNDEHAFCEPDDIHECSGPIYSWQISFQDKGKEEFEYWTACRAAIDAEDGMWLVEADISQLKGQALRDAKWVLGFGAGAEWAVGRASGFRTNRERELVEAGVLVPGIKPGVYIVGRAE